jgi:hypothetical protein
LGAFTTAIDSLAGYKLGGRNNADLISQDISKYTLDKYGGTAEVAGEAR